MTDTDCVNKAPAANLKCIIFSLVLASGYWFLPKRNKWILLALLYFPYLAIAWYDYYYACQRDLGPTYLALFYKDLKPQESDQIQTYKNWCPKWKRRIFAVDTFIVLLLVVLAVPFWKWSPSE